MLLEYNAGTMQERMCTAEEMSRKNWHDHFGCQTVQQCTGRWDDALHIFCQAKPLVREIEIWD